MNLIIDIGNTVAKLALFDEGYMKNIAYVSNSTLDGLEQFCSGYTIDKGIVGSVVAWTDETYERIKTLPFPVLIADWKTPVPITNLYKTPQTLGIDRVAAVVGANAMYPGKNILVIDAGTCITYEFVDAEGRYHGGNISPGLQMRLLALNSYTSRLPLVDAQGDRVSWGKDTETAIREGVHQGIEYEILGYINKMRNKYPQLLVFLTGGSDFSFDANVKSIIFADRFLVLKGLNRILEYNNDSKNK